MKRIYTVDEIVDKMPPNHVQKGDNHWETGCPVCGSDHHVNVELGRDGKK